MGKGTAGTFNAGKIGVYEEKNYAHSNNVAGSKKKVNIS
jgi:hypothetical protein